MRYIQSQHSFRQNQPKKSWWSRMFGKKRVITPAHDFSSRHTNPYNRKKKTENKFPFKTVGAVLLVVAWIGLMIYLPYFRITKTTVHGLRITKKEEIQSVIDDYLRPHRWWPDNNYFLIREEGIRAKLMDKFSFHDVQVTKIFPDSIDFAVEEKISSIIYDNGTSYHLLDQNGTVLKTINKAGESIATTSTPTSSVQLITTSTSTISFTTSTNQFPTSTAHIPDLKFLKMEYGDYPILYDLREPSVSDKQTGVLSKTIIEGTIELYSAFKRGKIASIRYGVVNDPNAGVELSIDKPWKIRFQPAHNITEQVENVHMILKQYKPTEYIDVRFGERVYWK